MAKYREGKWCDEWHMFFKCPTKTGGCGYIQDCSFRDGICPECGKLTAGEPIVGRYVYSTEPGSFSSWVHGCTATIEEKPRV